MFYCLEKIERQNIQGENYINIKQQSNKMTSSFQTIMAPYVNSEFIPNNLIPDVLSYYLKDHKIFHAFDVQYTHLVIKISINNLLQTPIANWSMNRPPDMLRCEDIAKSIYKTRMPIDSMIYLSYNNLSRTFEILDGIHRITALKIIKRENAKPMDLIMPGDFGYENDADSWLFNSYIIVNLKFNSPISEIIQRFQNLNKSNPVPDLYIKDNTKEKKTIIENITKQYQKLFKSHFSASQNPIVPNINREKFIEILDNIYDRYNITEETKDKIDELLTNANNFIKDNIPTKVSKKAIEKCAETGCYLFMLKDSQLLEII